MPSHSRDHVRNDLEHTFCNSTNKKRYLIKDSLQHFTCEELLQHKTVFIITPQRAYDEKA